MIYSYVTMILREPGENLVKKSNIRWRIVSHVVLEAKILKLQNNIERYNETM